MARIKIGNIKGPQGIQGPTGPKGPTGATGPQGPLPPLTNNGLATVPGVAALDAVMGKTLTDKDADIQQQVTQLYSDFRIDLGHSVEHVELGGTGADGKQWISFVSADSSKVSLELWPSAISLVHYDTKTQLWSTLWTLATK